VVLFCGLTARASFSAATAAVQTELGKWWKNSRIVKELQLSETQVARIEQSFLNFRPELANLNAELKRYESELKTFMQAEPVDDARVLSQSELIARTRTALEKAYASMLLAIRKDLTKEQWQKLEEIRGSQNAFRFLSMLPEHGSSEEGVYTIGDGIQPPRIIYQFLPAYTDVAKAKKIEGIVLLQVVIRKDGTAGDIKVLRGIGYGLDERAVNTIRKEWRFEPGTLNGQPVDVQANIEISFRLY
jgi:TonB family protein